jgi:hypothetical protein
MDTYTPCADGSNVFTHNYCDSLHDDTMPCILRIARALTFQPGAIENLTTVDIEYITLKSADIDLVRIVRAWFDDNYDGHTLGGA